MRAKLPLASALAFAISAGLLIAQRFVWADIAAVLCLGLALYLISDRDREVARLIVDETLGMIVSGRRALKDET